MVKSSTARLDAVFHALSDATRRAILRDVAAKEMTVGEVARPYAMSLAAVSKHLNVLEGAGLVCHRRLGREVLYSLEPKPLVSAVEFLESISAGWDRALARLKVMVEEQPVAHSRKAARLRKR